MRRGRGHVALTQLARPGVPCGSVVPPSLAERLSPLIVLAARPAVAALRRPYGPPLVLPDAAFRPRRLRPRAAMPSRP